MPFDSRIKPVENRVQQLEQAQGVTILDTPPPTASKPTEGLPTDAVPGRFYTFKSRNETVYVLGSDNVWRAILLVKVV
jgi:hypothetical protein